MTAAKTPLPLSKADIRSAAFMILFARERLSGGQRLSLKACARSMGIPAAQVSLVGREIRVICNEVVLCEGDRRDYIMQNYAAMNAALKSRWMTVLNIRP